MTTEAKQTEELIKEWHSHPDRKAEITQEKQTEELIKEWHSHPERI